MAFEEGHRLEMKNDAWQKLPTSLAPPDGPTRGLQGRAAPRFSLRVQTLAVLRTCDPPVSRVPTSTPSKPEGHVATCGFVSLTAAG